jgi:glutamine amidotransferase
LIRDNDTAVGVVNYGLGNIGNVRRALLKLGIRHEAFGSPEGMAEFAPSLLLLIGVGAFRPAMERLASSGWKDALIHWAQSGRPLLGICLGMQLLCANSTEHGTTEGLGLMEGGVRKLSGVKKIPHMGWNRAEPCGGEFEESCFIASGQNGQKWQDFYFVHSFAVSGSPHRAATTEVDGVVFDSALRKENVAGFQFHPERSGPEGVSFLGRAISYMDGQYGHGRLRSC